MKRLIVRLICFAPALLSGMSVTCSCKIAAAAILFDANGKGIYELAPDGSQTTFANVAATGLALDATGNLFDAEGFSPTAIYKSTPDGGRTLIASGLSNPGYLAVDHVGNLFYSQISSPGNVYKFTPSGVQATFASGLNYPEGLAFDASGNLFVAEYGAGIIDEFSPNGTRSTFASGLTRPGALAFDAKGNLFQGDLQLGTINEFTPNGALSLFASGLAQPHGIAFDAGGNLFVADQLYVYKFTPDGVRSTFNFGVGGYGLAFGVPEPPSLIIGFVGAILLSCGAMSQVRRRREKVAMADGSFCRR